MDRVITYPFAIPLETDILSTNKNTMIGLAKLSQALLGSGPLLNGLPCAPTSPASMQVKVGAGEIYAMANIDSTAYSSLVADTAHTILKQGISLDDTLLSCPAPGTAGQSINYLVQVTYQDTDATPVTLPYYNASNTAQAYSGPNNTGVAQNTVRKGQCIIAVKSGIAATTGTQVTPAPDSGYVGAWVVAVAYGASTIVSGNISQYSAAPFIGGNLLQKANVPTIANIAAMTALAPTSLVNDQQVVVSGYAAHGDGGGGVFYWDAASTATVDTGITFAANAGGTGRWIRADSTNITILHFGGSATASNATNKAALQAAIAAVSAAGGGRVTVPGGVNYGYIRTNNTTHPDFSSLTTGDVTVYDYGIGGSYTSPAKDGAQLRIFFGTKQTATPGQHDGNGQWVRGSWHPYVGVSNDAPDYASGANKDPYRASFFWEVDGNTLGWRAGIRDTSFGSSGTTPEQWAGWGLSCDGNFVFQGGSAWYAVGTMVMGVSRYYGTWGFNSYPDTTTAYKFYLPHGIASTVCAFIGDTATELPTFNLSANGSTNSFIVSPGTGNVNYQIGIAGTNLLKFDTGGHFHFGGTVPAATRNSIHGAYAEAAEIIQFYSTTTANDTMDLYAVAAFAANAGACAAQFGKNSSTSRSINAGGTVNASGADYAEYEHNNGLVIAKGAIVGFKADGTLTLTFADALRFGVKSTNPSYVGGDSWGSEDVFGPKPEDPTELEAWNARYEAARQLVDRIAYSGKVPVNVTGATSGQYIVASAADDGSITGLAVSAPSFGQYRLAVGRVNRVLDDGRAEIAVITH